MRIYPPPPVHMHMYMYVYTYGVATMSRMLKNTGLFAEYRSLL